jgi:hypothetical protein
MMPLLASLHAIAARRGDGLRPELISLSEQPEEQPEADFGAGVSSQDPVQSEMDRMASSGLHPISGHAVVSHRRSDEPAQQRRDEPQTD